MSQRVQLPVLALAIAEPAVDIAPSPDAARSPSACTPTYRPPRKTAQDRASQHGLSELGGRDHADRETGRLSTPKGRAVDDRTPECLPASTIVGGRDRVELVELQMCSPAEQRLWARMSVFRGDLGIEAIERVCSGDGIEQDKIFDLVASSVDKSHNTHRW